MQGQIEVHASRFSMTLKPQVRELSGWRESSVGGVRPIWIGRHPVSIEPRILPRPRRSSGAEHDARRLVE